MKIIEKFGINENVIKIVVIIILLIVLTFALFSNNEVRYVAKEVAHEVRTFDAWKQSALTPGQVNNYTTQNNFTSVAMPVKTPIIEGAPKPVLIKEMGIEVVAINNEKLKITGIMGSSWADKAGLKNNDILLRFNKKPISGIEHFKKSLSLVTPEKDYKVKLLRNGKVKNVLVTVGEGEMEGFTPIVPVALTYPLKANQGTNFYNNGTTVRNGMIQVGQIYYYHCNICGNTIALKGFMPGVACPICNNQMHRIR